MAFAFHKLSPKMVSTLEKSDPEGQEPPGKTRLEADPAVSSNKHLTRLVRFSILQARRSSSQASKNSNNNSNMDAKPPSPMAAGGNSSTGQGNPYHNYGGSPKATNLSPHMAPAKYPFAFGSFPSEKERPSTEVQYQYNDAPGQVRGGVGIGGAVVDVPIDPPIIEDLSASLTLSAGEESYCSGDSISDHDEDEVSANDHEDMDLLLAPDSGSGDGAMMMNPSSSNEVYNSAEMYSSSGDYEDGASQSSGISSSSSDSIMRRVEQEIANARKASNDAQARLAYFTQKQKELTPVMTDSYSFDFENLETTGDLHNMLDIGEGDDLAPPHRQQPSNRNFHGERRHQAARTPTHGHGHEDNFTNAMGVIGKEFDTSPAGVEEKVDIEVVLAPSQNQNNHIPQPPVSPTSRGHKSKSNIRSAHRSPVNRNNRSPRRTSPSHRLGGHRSPRQHFASDSVDIDEAVISAVFSEKSIESLPVKESLQDVFSEPSMDSLPTQPTQSSIERPGSFSFQDTSYMESPKFVLSPASQKRQNMLPVISKTVGSPQQRQLHSNLSIETSTDVSLALKVNASSPAAAISTPTSNDIVASPGRKSSKLPSTPRDPSTPSYRERLENKLKILGSRYPTSSPVKSTTPTSKKDYGRSSEKTAASASPSKTPKSVSDDNTPVSPKEQPSTPPANTAAPFGETYDGLESRIKDLLARTLHHPPADGQHHPSEKDAAYNSSPSAELKAIKKLLEKGVAAAAAAEERKKEREEPAPSDENAEVESLGLPNGEDQADDLTFPELGGATDEGEKAETEGTAEESQEAAQTQRSKSRRANELPRPDNKGIRLLPRSTGPVPAVLGSVGETKEPEPSVTCSTSEEILEQLDSFSQSTEFKSKARKSSNGKAASPRTIPPESKEALNGNGKKVVDQTGAIAGPDTVEEQPTLQTESKPKKGGKLVSSLKSFFEKQSTPPDSDAEVSGGKELRKGAAKTNVLPDSVANDPVTTIVDTDTPRGSDAEEQSALPLPAVNSGTGEQIEDEGHNIAVGGNDDVGLESIHKDDDDCKVANSNESSPAVVIGQEPSVSSSDQNLQASTKKTPSVLNAALCRPSPSESKDRKSHEKKIRKKTPPTNISPTEVEKLQTTNPVNASSSQVSENSTETFESSAEQIGEIPRPSVDATENPSTAEVHDQRHDEDANAKLPISEDSPESDIPKDRPNGTPDSQKMSETPPEDKSMLASIITPSNNSEREALPPKPKKASKDIKEASTKGDQHVPLTRGKTVSLQAPASHARGGERKVSSKVRNDIAKPKTTRQDRKIRFRDPYPTPKPCRKPRSNEEIQRDHSCRPSKADKRPRWKEPKGDLKRLLVAALDASLSRRSNACGALKVISKLEKNKVVLVRTTGFLEALVFVATDEVSSDELEAKEDARARAISCIYNVSHVKENRLIVCTHTGLLECLVKTINEDRGEARMEACGILAQLAKNPMCRDVMVDVEELLSTLGSVLKGTIDPEEQMLDILSQDITEEAPSSYSEMSSVLSEEHIPFPKNTGNPNKTDRMRMRPNCSIRKQKSEMYDQYVELARLSACAALIHLSKQCSVLDRFCSNMFLLESIVQVAKDFDSKLHGKCLEMLCNVSRLPGNTTAMTRFPGMVETLLNACSSSDGQDRVWALRTLQNMTSDAASKSTLATSTLLTLLINCVTSRSVDEQHAAMACLLNLSTDPSAVVPITSTKNVLATLVYLAHNGESTSEIRLMACNALATVGLWLQTVSGFGSIPEETRRVLLPSHKTTGWEIWD